MKKRGFTLVELLAVIVILGVIALIAVPLVFSSINSSKEGLYERQIDQLIQAGKNWGSKNNQELPKEIGDQVFLDPKDLAQLGFIDAEEILDPRTGEQIKGCVVVTKDERQYNYTFEEENCENVEGSYLITFDDGLNTNEEVEVNSVYTGQNVTAVDTEGNAATVVGPTIKNVATGNEVTYVDTSKVGNQFELTYTATDRKGNKKDLIIKVTVVDTIAPEIIVQGKNQNFTYYYSTRDGKFKIPEASVTDNSGKVKQYNGKDYKVTSNVSNIVGTYRIVYEAEDESGNKRTLTVTVVIENTTLPVIKEVTGNPTKWQNKDATLKISSVSSKTKIVGYSFDDGLTWQSSKSKVFDKNQTVKMKVKDQDGNVSRTYEVGITKIDKEPPTKPVIVLHKNNSGGTVISSGTWVNTNVSQEQRSTDSLSGIKGYERSLDKKKWTTMGVNAIESKEQEQHYYVRVKDNAGNISEVSDLYIIRIDKTRPVCTSSGGNSSWINYNWTIYGTCSDSKGSYRSGCTGNVQHTQTGEINTSTASPGTVYDVAGNSTKCPANQHLHIDKTKPSCSVSFSGTSGTNGWYKSNVSVKLSRQDNGSIQSGVSSYGLTTGGTNYNGSASNTQGETGGTTWNGYVKDRAGNTNSCSKSVKVDTTAPSCTTVVKKGSSGGANYTGGWYSGSIYTSANCGDSLSGCADKKTLTTSGATTPVTNKQYPLSGSWTVYANGTSYLTWKTYDNAGNSKTCSKITAQVDTKGPTITLESSSKGSSHKASDGSTCYTRYMVNPKCTDEHSGYSGYTQGNGDAYNFPVGKGKTRTVTCKDKAGNTTTKTFGPYNVCTYSSNSSCGYKSCRTEACGCADNVCTLYKRNIKKCGCATWGSSTSKYDANQDAIYFPYGKNCYVTPAEKQYMTSWKEASDHTSRYRFYVKGVFANCTLPNYNKGGYQTMTYRETQKCSTGKRCKAGGCDVDLCVQYKSCKNKACGYASCYHY